MNKYEKALGDVVQEYCNNCTCVFESEICKKKLCYRPIEALKELVEKATQKKVKNRVYRGTVVRQISNETPFSYDLIDGKCPCCGYKCGNTDEYCHKCGQALDWGDKNEI